MLFVLIFIFIGVAECSVPYPRCGENEVATDCRIKCSGQFCNNSYTDYGPCEPSACEPGCDCKADYLRNNKGICVFNENCDPPPTPAPTPLCGENEVATDCRIQCSNQFCNNSYTSYGPCEPSACEPGCDCKPDYLRNNEGICVLNLYCEPPPTPAPTPLCGENEVATDCRIQCSNQFCNNSYTSYGPCEPSACEPGCDCKPDYLRNNEGICVLNLYCEPPPTPAPTPLCGENEVATDCRIQCSNQFCNNSYTSYGPCEPSACEPGCDCKPDYLRNNEGICVLNLYCEPPPTPAPTPLCGENEVATDCRIQCSNQFCNNSYTSYGPCEPSACEPGCDCKPDYLRNNEGICVLNLYCEPPPSNNSSYCDDNQVPVLCTDICSAENCGIAGEGYLCIPLPVTNVTEETDRAENVIYRSTVFECPFEFDESESSILYAQFSKSLYDIIAQQPPMNLKLYPVLEFTETVVLYGVSLSEIDDEYNVVETNYDGINCTALDNNETTTTVSNDSSEKCGANQTFVPCNLKCPDDYCPKDDNRNIIGCDPPKPCLAGCRCALNYRIKSLEDPRCIVSTECPAVNCTRPHEVWDSCPSDCTSDRCVDFQCGEKDATCNTLLLNCKPQCVCEKGYCRNQNGVCVPKPTCY